MIHVKHKVEGIRLQPADEGEAHEGPHGASYSGQLLRKLLRLGEEIVKKSAACCVYFKSYKILSSSLF